VRSDQTVPYGVGRSVYESVNKGLCADYFGPTATTDIAFASIVLWDGLSTFVACATFPILLVSDPDGAIVIKLCMGFVLAGLLCSVLAELVHRRLRAAEREPLLYHHVSFFPSAQSLT